MFKAHMILSVSIKTHHDLIPFRTSRTYTKYTTSYPHDGPLVTCIYHCSKKKKTVYNVYHVIKKLFITCIIVASKTLFITYIIVRKHNFTYFACHPCAGAMPNPLCIVPILVYYVLLCKKRSFITCIIVSQTSLGELTRKARFCFDILTKNSKIDR